MRGLSVIVLNFKHYIAFAVQNLWFTQFGDLLCKERMYNMSSLKVKQNNTINV